MALDRDTCLDIIEHCARGGDVSATQLKAAMFMLARSEAEEGDKPADDLEVIYGDGNVTPIKRSA